MDFTHGSAEEQAAGTTDAPTGIPMCRRLTGCCSFGVSKLAQQYMALSRSKQGAASAPLQILQGLSQRPGLRLLSCPRWVLTPAAVPQHGSSQQVAGKLSQRETTTTARDADHHGGKKKSGSAPAGMARRHGRPTAVTATA